MSSCPRTLLFFLVLLAVCLFSLSAESWGQASHSERVQVMPPAVRSVDPPAPDATVADLEARGDELRTQKLYLDAIDYYRVALAKAPNSFQLQNKIGIAELMLQRNRDARKSFERSVKANPNYADAYNNLGVVYYEEKRYGNAIKQYRKAIEIDGNSAAFFSNLGSAQFSRKEFEAATASYQRAMEIDPEVFDRTSRAGVQAQLPSPEDRALYDYTVAKLFAKMGLSDRSLEYLRKAMEEGYKDFKKVYTDTEFAELRKDKRFADLVAAKIPALPN